MSSGLDLLESMEVGLSEDDILRWNQHARPFPLPPHRTPVSGAPLVSVSDEVLLNAPPQLIAHVQRTAAQGGLQIVSPRQAPFSALMTRSRGGQRQIGDHVVGSIAEETSEWPTLDDADFSDLLPDEPLPHEGADRSLRTKTRATPLTQATHHLSDPILACLIKGRAVIDLLRRDDVAGDADVYTQVLASAWGIAAKDIDDLDAFTLGIDGPLLRHAIKADEVYPMMYAPIHLRRCISVGSSEVTRHYLPDDSAMDWRRMRVHCEAVFAMTCMIEGHPIKYMKAFPPPGDMSAPSNRDNVMVFNPAPATAWTFEASTFSLYPLPPKDSIRASAIPADVLEALARYVKVVRPMAVAMKAGVAHRARRTTAVEAEIPYGETLGDAYRMMVIYMTVGAARGRLPCSTVRNLIYMAIEQAPLDTRLRMSRYIRIAQSECKAHLDLDIVPDRLIEKISDKFLKIGDVIRLRVTAEAARRGHTVEDWWADMVAQAPERYQLFSEGTKGWTMVAFWLLFRSPTERWAKLASAVHYSALRDAEVTGVGSMALPAEKGSVARLLAAARAGIKNLTRCYAGFYMGVADVGLSLADVAQEINKTRTAEILREASYMWVLRARALRGTNVVATAKTDKSESIFHHRIKGKPSDLVLVPAPYRAYKAYQEHVANAPVLTRAYKAHIAGNKPAPLSKVFREWGQCVVPAKRTKVTKYLLDAASLASDMERAWEMLVQDMYKIMRRFGSDERSRSPSPNPKRAKSVPQERIVVTFAPAPRQDYWSLTGEMSEDQVEWIEDVLERLGTAFEMAFYERTFASSDDLFAALKEAEGCLPQADADMPDTVR